MIVLVFSKCTFTGLLGWGVGGFAKSDGEQNVGTHVVLSVCWYRYWYRVACSRRRESVSLFPCSPPPLMLMQSFLTRFLSVGWGHVILRKI